MEWSRGWRDGSRLMVAADLVSETLVASVGPGEQLGTDGCCCSVLHNQKDLGAAAESVWTENDNGVYPLPDAGCSKRFVGAYYAAPTCHTLLNMACHRGSVPRGVTSCGHPSAAGVLE